MDKKEFFIKAMQARCYTKLAWIVTAFAITKPLIDKSLVTKAYEITSDPLGYWFTSEETNELVKIDNCPAGQAIFHTKEKLIIKPGDIPNLNEVVETTYGRLLFNWIVLVNSFGSKIPYQNNKIKLSSIEKIILDKLLDNPKNPEDRNEENIYIDEYLKYASSVYNLTGLSQICSQGATEKTLQAPPGIKEYRDSLLEEYKDSLNDMSTIAKIDAKLIEYDSEYLAGDDAENFLISGKSRNIVRKKLFLMLGGEVGLDDNTVKATLIDRSLSEGWDISKFPAMNDSLRAGSFNRGAQTELGGVAVKWLLRASSNINITVDDCGSLLGTPIDITKNNMNKLVGFSIIDKNKTIAVDTVEQAGTYLGQRILLRNPMYCILDQTDYCKICVGKRLVINPTGLSVAISEYGSKFLAMFLQAAHGKQLQLAKLDLNGSIT